MEGRKQLKKGLKPAQVGSLALGCIIGFGCFVLPGDFLARSGPMGAAIGIILGGIVMIVIARAYGLMVRRFAVAGAEFAYAYYACGRYHAYICGWFLTLGYLSIVPLNATALALLGKFLVPGLFARGYLYSVAGFEVFAGEIVLASVAIAVMGYLNYRGVEKVGNAQFAMTGLLIGAVVVIGAGGFLSSSSAIGNWRPHFPPAQSPFSSILATLAITPWLYVGFDTVPQAAEEFDFSPARVSGLMAVAIMGGALMYVTVLLATGVVAPWRELVAEHHVWPTGTTVAASLGAIGLMVLSVAVCMAIFTGINGFYMATSRLMFSMGRAKILPDWFTRIHPTYGTPYNAIVFTGLISLLAPWFGRQAILWVVDMSALGTAFGYTYTCVAAYSLVKHTPDLRSVKKEKWLPFLGALCSAGFIVLLSVPGMPAFMSEPSRIALMGWVALGLVFYLLRSREYSRLPKSELDHLILGR
jgi:amino acid transporter